ncbi:fatty-acid-binding protein 3, chloroplastic [Cinnamomum micranthum f. kanehirae]|uniref:Chalcone-flavonone isomerase family protein n=1 Tax=Cinnamomum micranthum f. kanehirae TaxID=337451 RepID=A0A3S3PR97_9MAGN|nr:fatty-acid-binding protein 3, chloroplastic [Cinnamomum micranthum f. kanehirae]
MAGALSSPAMSLLTPISEIHTKNTKNFSFVKFKRHPHQIYCYPFHSTVPTSLSTFNQRFYRTTIANSSSVGSTEFVLEPGTSVKFPTGLSVPGCSDSLVLLGTGYREKVFAIIGVKVYAAGLYVSRSLVEKLNAWKGRQAAEIQNDSTLFSTLFEAPVEKSLQIVLVRDVDGKTFWGALDDAISPRIKSPIPVDESALSTFRITFQGRPLKQGTVILLTWVEPSKMLVSISSDGSPSAVDATIESINVASALFDAFLGDAPVSPPLKASVAKGLAILLK